jgi:hypothetical protein
MHNRKFGFFLMLLFIFNYFIVFNFDLIKYSGMGIIKWLKCVLMIHTSYLMSVSIKKNIEYSKFYSN